MVIKNLWSKVELQCIRHVPPVSLYVFEGSATPFYACPKYMKKDENHPDGHEESEQGCSNRISFDDVRHLVEKLSEAMAEDQANGVVSDYTGMRIKWKTIDAKVLSYTNEKIILGIENRRKIGQWQA